MLNFNGQVNRRKVNMGSRIPRITKDSLLRNAELERARRQQERAELNSVLTVQRHIRKRISTRNSYKSLIRNSSKLNHPEYIITAFNKRLYSFLDPEEYIEIINRCVISEKLSEVLSEMLGDVKERKTSPQLDTLLIQSAKVLDIATTPRRHILNKVSFIQNCPYELSETQITALVGLESVQEVYHGHWNVMFYIDEQKTEISSNYLGFLRALFSSNHIPDMEYPLKDHEVPLVNYINNFLSVFQYMNGQRLIVFSALFLIACSQLSEPLQLAQSLFQNLSYPLLLESFNTFPKYNDFYWSGLDFLLNQVRNVQKSTLLLSIVSNSSVRTSLLDALRNGFTYLEIKKVSVCSQMLNFYIPLSPDDHIFTTVITKSNLQSFTINMAKFLISTILSPTRPVSSAEIETFIELMWNLIYLDSRVEFLENGTGTFWDLLPADFHDLDITKEILDFEQYYREYLIRIEEMNLDEDEMFDKKKAMDQGIKSKYLEELKSKRRISSNRVGKLELLFKFPFMIKFFERVDYFNVLIEQDRLRINGRNNLWGNVFEQPRLKATIRREHALEDAYEAFASIGEGFKEKLGIQFVNDFGPEAGIDGGGITKEFLQTLIQEGFIKNSFELFDTTPFNKLYPSKNVSSQNLKYISFMGKVLGKCLYEHILVDVELSDFFLKKILNVENDMNVPFNDLYSLDPEYYRNLMKLLEMSKEELEFMDLYFEVPDTTDGKRIPLIKDGLLTKVNPQNVFEYITRVSHYKLNLQLYTVTSRFISGLSYMIPPHWLRMFTSYELKTLISGSEKDFDLEDLKKHTQYGGYTENSLTIQYFWKALGSFTMEERRKFLKFVFSVPTAPLKGFHSLNPLFGIRNAGEETDRLPTASTCVNLLKLPDYKDYKTLREKLLTSINSDSRFELS